VSKDYEVSIGTLNEYLDLRRIEGLSSHWLYQIEGWLKRYLDTFDWRINKQDTLKYLNHKKKQYGTATFRKVTYQIRKFLLFLDVEWANKIIPPAEPEYSIKRVTKKDIQETIKIVSNNRYGIRYVALTLLGASSGMRPEEMYQLNLEDIDIKNNIIHINHNPKKNQTTKSKKSRISFFNQETKKILIRYLSFYREDNDITVLFPKRICERVFQAASIQVMDLRKFFSQEWDRLGGATSVKKILMGHSLKGDVDLMHYNYQSEEDLKRIYDRVNIKIK